MRIGAGGLQSIIMSDMMRSLDPSVRPKAGIAETLLQAQGRDQNQLRKELNRAVERLNHLAHALNYPVQIVIKEPPPRLKVVLKDKRTGQEREIEYEELDKLAAQLEDARGVQVDGYA
ncbi:flagellar protein FlaG [Desulfotomaculum sp. 1211_IL3151]|uniref:flagellar protein FlaG n=1 Tax=Desulfotomaculum sp. 1211_IL3151 TaxID=3084055 RepID=UPI002FD880C8